MARVMIAESILQEVANAIRTASSTSATLRPIDFAEKILNLSGGGDSSVYCSADTYVSSSTLNNDSVTADKLVYAYFPYMNSTDSDLFANYTKLIAISAPSLESIPMNFLRNCSQLASVSFPSATTVQNYAFENCNSLNRIDLPSCTSVENFAFMSFTGDIHFAAANESAIKATSWYQSMQEGASRAYFDLYASSSSGGGGGSCYCSEVTEMTSSTLSDSGYSDSASKDGIKYAYLPNATTLSDSAFSECRQMQSVYLPKAASMNNMSFQMCDSLTDIHVPSANKSAIINAMGLSEGDTDNVTIKNATVYFDLFSGGNNVDPETVACVNSVSAEEITQDIVNDGDLSSYFNDENYSGVIIKPVGGTAEKTVAVFALPDCTSIGNMTFIEKNKMLKYVNMPNVLTVGNSAFSSCYKLTTVDLPACTSVGDSAFSSCSQLTTLDLPACTSVGDSAFSSCYKLTTVDLPACTSVGDSAFSSCYKLTTVDLPACTSVGDSAFSSCSQLTTLDLPACTSLSYWAFISSSLTEIHFAAENQATIEALSNYNSKFGATNATIYFDL